MLRYDVFILGAGAAGLAAASRLSHEGLSVVVAEARDRIGGRIRTERVRELGAPLELGAEFLHGEAHEVRRLAERHGLRLIGGGEPDPRFWARMDEVMSRLAVPTLGDRSLAEALRAQGFLGREPRAGLPPDAREAAAMTWAFVEGFHAADPEEISVKALAAGGPADRVVERVEGGYDRVLAALVTPDVLRGLRLNTVVSSIHWTRGSVVVRSQSRSGFPNPLIRASRAIVTLPIGVWHQRGGVPGAVRFHPELAAKREQASRLAMGPVVKLLLRFKRISWDPDEMEFRVSEDRRAAFPTWWSGAPSGVPLLTAWAGGPRAARLQGLRREELVRHAADSLGGILGVSPGAIREELQEAYFHDWQLDPYSRGAYSYVKAGGVRAPKALSRPVEETLYFAGEALAPEGRNGTVDGALASGDLAAAEVLESWRRHRRPEKEAAF